MLSKGHLFVIVCVCVCHDLWPGGQSSPESCQGNCFDMDVAINDYTYQQQETWSSIFLQCNLVIWCWYIAVFSYYYPVAIFVVRNKR